MFGPRLKQLIPLAGRRAAPDAAAGGGDVGIPDVPSLEGYTIAELRTEQLARLIHLEELQPEQVAHLIRTLTRGGR
ncbi:MAG TPA: hypothetical protein VML91_23610 [Burkholderiales bacterium]|nr:hypothetical protein [Burkholderiales bacterium]